MPPEGAQGGLFADPEPRDVTLGKIRAWARLMLKHGSQPFVVHAPNGLDPAIEIRTDMTEVVPPGLELDEYAFEQNRDLPGAQDRYLDEAVRRACRHMLRALGERV